MAGYAFANPPYGLRPISQTPRRVHPVDPAFISTPRHLFKSLDQPLALEAGQPLDPEQAVQLIDLMLVTDGAQTLRFLALQVAVDVVIADPDAGMTLDVVVNTR